MKTWAMTLGLGAALGAIAVLALPQGNPARKLATQAASKVDCAANRISGKLNSFE